jgi:ferrous iron transport protein B
MFASLVVGWSSFLAYWAASCLYQVSNVVANPVFALSWLGGAAVAMYFVVLGLRRIGQSASYRDNNIIASSMD